MGDLQMFSTLQLPSNHMHVHRKGSDHWSEAGVWGEGGGGGHCAF